MTRLLTLYTDGFRQMTLGRTLWAVIAVKLVIIALIYLFAFRTTPPCAESVAANLIP